MKVYPRISGKINSFDAGLIVILALTAFYGLLEAFQMHQELEPIITLWLLAAGMSIATVRGIINAKNNFQENDTILSWILLACAAGTLLLTAFISNSLAIQVALLLFMGACLARFTTYPNVFKLFPAGIIFLLLLPNLDYFNSRISYPLRLICTQITGMFLKICTLDASCDGTVLRIGAEKIAVTAACSGIAQLESMFFIGWLITMLVHKRLICRISHWLLLLPIVILLNSLRLTITMLLYSWFGEAAFSDMVHTTLGYAMVVAVAVVFWACRSLIPFSERNETNEAGK